MRWLSAAVVLWAAGCTCVAIPDGQYACDEETGADCDGGFDGGGGGAGGDGGTDPAPFPTGLCNGSWCWDNPKPVGRVQLRSVLELAKNDVWIAGNAGNLIHWDGRAFAQVPTGVSAPLQRIWALDPHAVWITGGQGTLLEWDGARLVRHDAGTNVELRAITGTAPREPYVFGSMNNTALHFDGTTWSRPIVPTAMGGLYTAASWPDAGILALGDWGLRNQGGQWSAVPRPDGGATFTLWAPSPTDVWACGAAGGLFHNTTGDFSQQAAWQQLDSGTAFALSAVFSLGTHLYWGGQGGMWESTAPVQLSNRNIGAIHGLAENDVWAVGQATLLHRSVKEAFFDEHYREELTTALQGVTLLPDGTAWAVGNEHGVFFRDGGTWSRQRNAGNVNTGWYFDVWTMPGAPVIAVGASPIQLAYWDAGSQTMTPIPVGFPEELWGVWGASEKDIWAVGQAMRILRFNGDSWDEVPTNGVCSSGGTPPDLEQVWGTRADDVWIAGSGGCVIHWDGRELADESISTTGGDAINSIGGLSGDGQVWVSTNGGAIFRRMGEKQWMPELPMGPVVREVVGHDGVMYGVGDGAQVLQRDSNGTWRRMVVPLEPAMNLQSIAGYPDAGLMAVGATGVILYRR